jgi:hypothetical protein
MTYQEVADRRKNLGAGIAELHRQVGITTEKYGVGLWSQNRPEWQIAGEYWLWREETRPQRHAHYP